MENNLIDFPNPHTCTIPTPICAHQGDSFERVDITDDSITTAWLPAGAFVTVLVGSLWDKYPHALIFDGEVFLGMVACLDADTIEFDSWHQGKHSGIYPLTKAKPIGPIAEMFPLGEDGPRLILYPKGRNPKFEDQYSRPVLSGIG